MACDLEIFYLPLQMCSLLSGAGWYKGMTIFSVLSGSQLGWVNGEPWQEAGGREEIEVTSGWLYPLIEGPIKEAQFTSHSVLLDSGKFSLPCFLSQVQDPLLFPFNHTL